MSSSISNEVVLKSAPIPPLHPKTRKFISLGSCSYLYAHSLLSKRCKFLTAHCVQTTASTAISLFFLSHFCCFAFENTDYRHNILCKADNLHNNCSIRGNYPENAALQEHCQALRTPLERL
jgi:hypothetical protein